MFSCSQDSNRCFFSSLLQRIGLSEFSEKNIYVKKNPRKKGVYLLTVFIFCLPFCVITAIFFVFVFVFLVICKKRMASALLAPALLVSRKSRIFTRFFYLKSSLGSLIGMCTNSRFFGRF